ncbi:metallophosphoesterase family protein [Pelodictyon luteolum]|uniref:Serine/threonine protein phosphatase n=1 Tax=Chlorobium luteolum (strain DSM 273 / BCRC 81028 / 2530) TaxID=319225 RepID=Q3B297_CHLL3|nr:metallophosphoesterase family protein [Pelodictyon luteolum]ABB24534.1 serine/threonine protein phosphatase [Pelodictyon luteolum DSM 273]
MQAGSHLTEENRIIAIGDVHGCIRTLKGLLHDIGLQPEDQLVFLGDIIDRGPSSMQTVEFVLELRDSFSCHFIAGNHELMLLDALDSGKPDAWIRNGGMETLDSYGGIPPMGFPEPHLDLFRECRPYLETEHWFFAHGGLDPDISIRDGIRLQSPEDFSWQRAHMRREYLERNEYIWEKTLVCGHTPVPAPVMLERLIAIDTGCVHRERPHLGTLSAVILPERRIVQQKNIEPYP